MKDLFIEIHEELTEQYLEWNPHVSREHAYEVTAAKAYDLMRERLADIADNREHQHGL